MNRQDLLPQLTGIRAIAFLMVFLFHVGSPGLLLWSGVDLFFVLSGFLITGILLRQEKSQGFFRVFYTRRFLRIFPPFYLVLVVGILMLPPVRIEQSVSIATFLTNFYIPFSDQTTAPRSYWALAPYWSLALEEQFYLAWPWLVYALQPRRLLAVCVGLIGAAPVLRGLSHHFLFESGLAHYDAVFHLPWNRVDLLASGAVIALCRHLQLWDRETIATIGVWLIVLCATLFVLTALNFSDFRISGHSVLFSTLGLTLICGVMSGAIMYLANSDKGLVVRTLSYGPVVYLGTISYTMYLVHGVALTLVGGSWGFNAGWQRFVGGFALTFIFAALSWHWLEKPIKQIKDSRLPG